MGMTTYVIAARPGKLPTFYLMGQDGVPQTPLPAASVAPEVLRHATWLSALADGRRLPPGDPPPAVFAPAQPGGAFTAVVTIDEAQI
jgi:hypothetical protein